MEHIRREGYNITEPRRLNPDLTGQRCRDRYCLFHRDYGHDTEFCQQLKEEIERLIKRGHLRRFIYKKLNGREVSKKKTLKKPQRKSAQMLQRLLLESFMPSLIRA